MLPQYPKIMPMPMAQNGNKNSIPTTTEEAGLFSYNEGFPQITQVPVKAGGKAPQRTDFNGVLNELSQHLFYLQGGGQYQWKAELDYAVGSIILGSDNIHYKALRTSGPNSGGAKDPTISSNSSFWKKSEIELVQTISETDLASEDKAPSEKAVRKEFTNQKSIIDTSLQSLTQSLAQKVDKSSISSSLTSTSTTTVASSKAVKDLNDKITSQNGKLVKKGTRSTTGTWTITGLVVGKPVFIFCSGNTVYTPWAYFNTSTAPTGQIGIFRGCGVGSSWGNEYYSNVLIFIPQAASVTISVDQLAQTSNTEVDKKTTLYAYQ